MIDIKNIAMELNELIECLRWSDLPDCKKYKDLLESEDREVVKLAIELLTIDNVDKRQIKICRSRFLQEIWLGDGLIGQMTINESKYYRSPVSIVI
jgi:hypothetical protein